MGELRGVQPDKPGEPRRSADRGAGKAGNRKIVTSQQRRPPALPRNQTPCLPPAGLFLVHATAPTATTPGTVQGQVRALDPLPGTLPRLQLGNIKTGGHRQLHRITAHAHRGDGLAQALGQLQRGRLRGIGHQQQAHQGRAQQRPAPPARSPMARALPAPAAGDLSQPSRSGWPCGRCGGHGGGKRTAPAG